MTGGLGGLLAELTSVEGLRMVAAHLIAATVVGLWLATGERVLWFCLRRIAYAARTGLAALRRILQAAVGVVPPQPAVEPGWMRPGRRPADGRLAHRDPASRTSSGQQLLTRSFPIC